jgi:EAL and modified HD-GYP domain-containing signal transduction protein
MTVPSEGRPFGRSRGGLGLSRSSLSAALAGAGSAPPTVFVAREAIVDRNGDVFAYELHLHPGLSMPSAEQDDAASAPALVAAVIELGVERLANNRPVLLGVTPAILRDVELLELTGKNVGFVILEGSAEPAIVERVAGLAAAGRIVALADYRSSIRMDALLPHAQLAKIEVGDGTHEEIEQRCAAARAYGAQLVAGGIDSPAAFRWSHDARFDLFQGDTHAQPPTVSGRGSRADQAATLNLLLQLSAAATSVDELERIVASDLGLTVSTLHAVNSAAIALPNRITSIRQAIVLLGGRAVHALAALLAMTQLSDAPVELSRRALIRASMCDALARGSAEPHPERFFTAGMLSMAGALLDLPLERVVAELPLADEIADALTEGTGSVGPILTSVISYEQARFGSMAAAQTVIRRDIANAYMNAVAFADELTSSLDARRAA